MIYNYYYCCHLGFLELCWLQMEIVYNNTLKYILLVNFVVVFVCIGLLSSFFFSVVVDCYSRYQ